jgi:hypothetical protein
MPHRTKRGGKQCRTVSASKLASAAGFRALGDGPDRREGVVSLALHLQEHGLFRSDDGELAVEHRSSPLCASDALERHKLRGAIFAEDLAANVRIEPHDDGTHVAAP